MLCGKPASHKVGEEMYKDDPYIVRHGLTAYVCCVHFGQIFGKETQRQCVHAAKPDEEIGFRLARVVRFGAGIVTVKDSLGERFFAFGIEKVDGYVAGATQLEFEKPEHKGRMVFIETLGNHVTKVRL